jgi:predicted transcriptional regulator
LLIPNLSTALREIKQISDFAGNMAHPQTVRYLKGLIDEGLFILTKSRPGSYYEITPRDQRCLQIFAEMEDNMRPVHALETFTDRIT